MPPRTLDPRAPRFNQGVVGAAALVAFAIDAPLVVPALAALLAAGAFLGPDLNPLSLLWRHVVVPVVGLGPPARVKPAAPVRFAQGVGLAFLVTASILILGGVSAVAGWALTLVVAGLALLAALTDICVGCEAYVLLRTWTARPRRLVPP